jgi:hypothetical protein
MCIDDDEEHLAEHFTALISGKIFTTDPNRITEEGFSTTITSVTSRTVPSLS